MIDDEDRTKKLAEIISNKTCKKIINYLKENEASETDIAKNLNLPLSTIHYNLQKLLESKVIEVKEFYWSPKGNKVNIYKVSSKMPVLIQEKSRHENTLKIVIPIAVAVVLIVVIGVIKYIPTEHLIGQVGYGLNRFQSGDELIKALEEGKKSGRGGLLKEAGGIFGGIQKMTSTSEGAADYSRTNIQVEGVDEADIVKTDGKYIYVVNNKNLIIAKAYPSEDAEILSKINFEDYNPEELFIDDDKLLIFGYSNYDKEEVAVPYYSGFTTVKLYNIKDKENPELIKNFDFEGGYLTSRKIDENVYFVVNSYPHYYKEEPICEDVVPLYREDNNKMEPITECTQIGYVRPIQAESFITIASISFDNGEINKETIVGSGQNVYASLENLYIAQTSWPEYNILGQLREDAAEETTITKFNLDKEKIKFIGTGTVKGHILNQFSMDEYDNHFRIATTSGEVWGGKSRNNIYILDNNLNIVGKLEDLAPGEKIYSVRFMGKRGYIVTFKKIDPLFVIDLSDYENPSVLGKLKIPGYSDYLHPYDENHIIGIGKETVEAEENLKEQRQLGFAWYQGLKIAIFDVSDVENPIEMHKVVIGDRGTDSDALHDHKAFLFDKKKELLVIPITLAEIKGEKTADNQYGEFTFQGAYVYNINLEEGFKLKGRITHYENDEEFKKSGFYFRGDNSIKRSLYIDDMLYTISNNKVKINSLGDLSEIKELVF